ATWRRSLSLTIDNTTVTFDVRQSAYRASADHTRHFDNKRLAPLLLVCTICFAYRIGDICHSCI
ncbi:MAG: hypothetical protein ABF629_04575, partial [Sporolactobacillus sp.]